MDDLIFFMGMFANIAQIDSYEKQQKDYNNLTLFKKLSKQNEIMIKQNIIIIEQNKEIISLLKNGGES